MLSAQRSTLNAQRSTLNAQRSTLDASPPPAADASTPPTGDASTPPTADASTPPTADPGDAATDAADADAEPEAPAPLPSTGPADAAVVGAVGSDEPPLPPAPPRARGRIVKGPWFGRGWLELGADLVYIGHLPQRLRILSAGLSGGGGFRPHRWFGVGMQLSTWVSDVQQHEGVDDLGQPVTVRASVPVTVWDALVLRGFVPLRSRVEPHFDLATGLAVERNPFAARKPWGTLRVGAGFDVYLTPGMTLGLGIDYRLLARRDAYRHSVAGRARLGFHF